MRYIALCLAVATLTLFSEEAKVYEGRSAADWGERLAAVDFNKVKLAEADAAAQNSPDVVEFQHVVHALTVLGGDSLKPLAAVLRRATTVSAQQYVSSIFYQLKVTDKEQFLAGLLELLKDEHYSVRRVAIETLGSDAYLNDPKAEAAIKEMLKDRDLAVVETAQGTLEQIRALREQKAQEKAQLDLQIKVDAANRKAAKPEDNF